MYGSHMKVLGSPMRIMGSPMKRQAGSPMKRGLRWVSDDDDFFPDSTKTGLGVGSNVRETTEICLDETVFQNILYK